MAGHSKWKQIKRKKAVNDSARGKMFTKIIKEMTVASRIGGGDPEGNPRLRLAIQQAKDNNMPSENITRAIKKGTGELEGVNYEEMLYEGYGPAGVALIIESLTDNKNRTVADLRHIMSRNHGNLAESGAVSWNFERKGIISVLKGSFSEDELLNVILEASADDLIREDDYYQVTTALEKFDKVRKAIETSELSNVKIENASIQYISNNTVKVEKEDAEKTLKLISAIEDNDDVQNVYTNADIDENVLAELSN